MKHKLNALLLIVAFPLLLIGGNQDVIPLSIIGVGLLLLDAGIIIVKALLPQKNSK